VLKFEASKMMKMNIILVLFCIIVPLAFGELKVGFYDSSCPKAESIVKKVVQNRFNRDNTITAALLRLHFHDCAVRVRFCAESIQSLLSVHF